MSDLELLQEFNAEPEQAEQTASGSVGDFLEKPLGLSENKVQVTPGEKVEESIKKDKKKSSGSLFKTASTTKKNTEKILGAAVPDLGDLPTPPTGGIGLLVFISLLVVFAITPAGKNGATRLSLIWGSILGNNSLPNNSTPPPSIGATAPGVAAVVPSMDQLIQGGYYS